MAARKGHTAVVELLLKVGASIDVQKKTGGDTALTFASWKGHIAVIN